MTKYDASSADISCLGSVTKEDIRAFQRYARDKWDLTIIDEFLDATRTAELVPGGAQACVLLLLWRSSTLLTHEQSDEEEMGLLYRELSSTRTPIGPCPVLAQAFA